MDVVTLATRAIFGEIAREYSTGDTFSCIISTGMIPVGTGTVYHLTIAEEASLQLSSCEF